MRAKRSRKVTTQVQVPSYGEGILLQRGQEFRAGFLDNLDPMAHDWPPQPGDFPLIPLPGPAWTVLPGGVTIRLRWTPGARSVRVPILIMDARSAREIYALDQDRKHLSAFLYYTGGAWYLTLRWHLRTEEARDLTATHGKPRTQRKHRVRWSVAPPDWPRDRYGRPVSTRVQRRMAREAKLNEQA